MSQTIDPLEIATQELAEAQVPTPEDLLADVGPLGCLWYVKEAMAITAMRWVDTLPAMEDPEADTDTGPVRSLQMLTEAMGAVTAACVEVSLLPREAAELPKGGEA